MAGSGRLDDGDNVPGDSRHPHSIGSFSGNEEAETPFAQLEKFMAFGELKQIWLSDTGIEPQRRAI
jgi:hypothetical protein